MTATTRVNITATDKTGAAFKSVDRSITTVAGSVGKLTGMLGALAVGFSALGAVNAIKGVIDANDALAKMSASTGIAVESLAGLEFAAAQSGTTLERTSKGVRAFSKIVLESNGETDRYSKLISALGLNLEALKNATPEDQFVSLAGALKNNVAEQERAAVVTSLLGDRYAELIPLLSQGEAGLNRLIAEGKELNPVTAESAKKSEEFNDSLDKLGRSFDALIVEAAASILPMLNAITTEMVEATKQSGFLIGALTGIGEAAKRFFESDFFVGVVGASGPLGALLKAKIEAKKAAESLKEIEDQADDTADALKDIDTAAPKSFSKILKEIKNESDGATASTKKLTKELSEEAKQAAAIEKEIRDLTRAYDPLIKRNEELARLNSLLNAGLPRNVYDAAARAAIEDYMQAVDGVDDATKNVKKSTDDLGNTGQRVFESMSEFAIQGARSIQTALSDALLEGIDDFKSFSKSVLDIIKRMAANIASVKILEGLGIGSLLGVGSSSAFAGGSAGGGSNILGGLSNAFSTGFGLNSVVSSGLGVLGSATGSGTLSAFASGLGGDVVGGVIAGTELGLGGSAAAGAAGFGSAAAAVAGPAIIAYAATEILKSWAGDKKIGGGIGDALNKFSDIPVLGSFNVVVPLLNKLFGRGPLKQQDSLIRGNITEQGISDDFLTATNFKAKGGVFRGDKVDRVIINANTGELINGAPGLPESGIDKSLLPFAVEASKQALAIGEIFNEAIQGFNVSLSQTGEILGIGSSQLDHFQRWIQFTADSAEGITQTQIADEIQNIGDHMANVLLPGLQDMRKDGETATQALGRMVNEFTSLENALVVFGVSAADANTAISALSVTTRTELIEAAGGVDALNSKIAFFANNFLTLEEQFEIGYASLDKQLQKVGLSANMTVKEFKNLILSVTQVDGASVDLVNTLLELAPVFLNVKNTEELLALQSEQTADSVDVVTDSVGDLGDVAAETAAIIQTSFSRIDTARTNLKSAQGDLAVALARERVGQEQVNFNNASANLAEAKRDLATAQAAEENRARQDQADAINEVILQRSELISTYEQEASTLKGVVDRFGALFDKILEFKDSLALGNLSPLSPGEQLAFARQQFNATRGLAAQGDEGALDRLNDVSKVFLEASLTANGATGTYESDFNFVQQVLESSGATAKSARDIAQSQLTGIESTIENLKALNETEEKSLKEFTSINTGVMSVAQATQNLARKQAEFNGAKYNYDTATDKLGKAITDNGGFITEVAATTDRVDQSVRELAEAVLQGFGNAFISDQKIRDYVLANPNKTDQQLVQDAIDNNISGPQLARALAPLGVTQERINTASQGASVRPGDIASFVDQKLAERDFYGIYSAAMVNGITSQQLARDSVLSKEEIDSYVRANNLAPFKRGTDFIPRDGIAMLHKGEAVVPSSTTDEIKRMRQENIEWQRDQNRQMSALINIVSQSSKENAQAIAKSNEKLAASANWQNRSRPKVA